MSTSDELLARIENDLSVSQDAMRSIPDARPFDNVIRTFSRAQAIGDGSLVSVAEDIASQAGFRIPVAMTRAAWEDCVAWNARDSARQTPQDENGRLWDVLFMTALVARRHRNSTSMSVDLYRVPRGGRARAARRVRLLAIIGPGDAREPVITISQPNED